MKRVATTETGGDTERITRKAILAIGYILLLGGLQESWPDFFAPPVFNHGIRALKQSRRLWHQTKSNHGLGPNKNDKVRFC